MTVKEDRLSDSLGDMIPYWCLRLMSKVYISSVISSVISNVILMLGRHFEMREWMYEVVGAFRQKGAVSPEKALSMEELNLPPNFEELVLGPPGLLGVFVEVDGKYYLSEERLERFVDQIKGSRSRFRRLLRHTASVPKGFLRFYMLRLLRERSMSGSEIMAEIERQTDGRWKPSPGSVYPLLTWFRENGYTKEVKTEESDVKRYVLTEKGEQVFKEQVFEKMQKKFEFSRSFFFNGLWLGIPTEKIREIQEPFRRFTKAFLNLRMALRDNLTEHVIKDVGKLLRETTEKIEELNSRIKNR